MQYVLMIYGGGRRRKYRQAIGLEADPSVRDFLMRKQAEVQRRA